PRGSAGFDYSVIAEVSETAKNLLEEMIETAAVMFAATARVIIVIVATEPVVIIIASAAIGILGDVDIVWRYRRLLGLDDLVPAALQRQRDALLMAVDIVEGFNFAVRVDAGREVGDVNRDRPRQGNLILLRTFRHEIVDGGLVPAFVIIENDLRHRDGVTHAHAAVAERPNAFVEQRLARRVVQINCVPVWE